ncbi:hypothetical protein DXB15_09235 [Roseburia sp. OM02-15]|nr:hypothetical protein DXB15_09235 [Roseburia sp. OM02-15]
MVKSVFVLLKPAAGSNHTERSDTVYIEHVHLSVVIIFLPPENLFPLHKSAFLCIHIITEFILFEYTRKCVIK